MNLTIMLGNKPANIDDNMDLNPSWTEELPLQLPLKSGS